MLYNTSFSESVRTICVTCHIISFEYRVKNEEVAAEVGKRLGVVVKCDLDFYRRCLR